MAEKTEAPTPRRLREARRRGEVAKSADLSAGLGLLPTAAAIGATAPGIEAMLVSGVRDAASLAAAPPVGDPGRLLGFLQSRASAAAVAVAPVLAVAVLAGAGVTAVQVGGLLAPGAVLPRPQRIDPVRGAGRLLSAARLVDVAKALAKLALLAGVAVGVAVVSVRGLVALAGASPDRVLGGAAALSGAVLFRGSAVLAAFGVLDLFHQRWRFRRERRMSKDEVRRERKDQEGDPLARQERQRAHREIVEHAIVEDVRQADVLVVNPTHLAAALRYDPDGDVDAPELVAKGQGDLARRMVDAAREAGVPVLRDVALARELVALDLGEAVPERLFDAVAAVLQAAWDERGVRRPAADGAGDREPDG